MRKANLLLLLLLLFSFPLRAQNPEKPKAKLSAASLPQFLGGLGKWLDRTDAAFGDLANENLALRDAWGQPLGRRRVDDRRAALAELRQTEHLLAGNPQDLVLTTRLFIQTEALTDDLFDLSQIAYDNDREDLAKRFSDLETGLDGDLELLESYALDLAAQKEARLQELEKQNRQLQEKLKEAANKPEGKQR